MRVSHRNSANRNAPSMAERVYPKKKAPDGNSMKEMMSAMNDINASLIHEAAIGKIAGEQLIKLMTLGLTEKEAEEQIVSGFLK